jgi:hypothetical protein
MLWVIQLRKYTTNESESNENLKYLLIYEIFNIYGTAEHNGRGGVLIHDAYPDVWRIHSLLRGDVPSTAAVVSDVTIRCAWPGRGEFVTEQIPFINFLVHSYTWL